MIDISGNLRIILEKILKLKPGQNLLVITDPYARSKYIAQTITDLSNSIGIQAVLIMMEPRIQEGDEPPAPVSEAMKLADAILDVGEKAGVCHTTARKAASEKGAKYFNLRLDVSEDYLRNPISMEDLKIIKKQTEKMADIMTKASVARVTTPYGTDIVMSLEGRKAIPVQSLSNFGVLIDYAEAAISPVEGTTEGVVVVDASVRGWGYVIREPIRFEVKKGRAQIQTVSSDNQEQAEKFKNILLLDQNSSNCAAELGIGTRHTGSRILLGDIMFDYAMAGTVHIALGRNNDIGGQTLSKIHQDVLMTRPSIKLDEVYVVENGKLKI